MGIDRMWNTTCTIVHRSDSTTRDAHGNLQPAESTETAGVPCYFEQTSGDEPDGQEASTAILLLPAETTIDSSDHVQVDGATWTVRGRPNRRKVPGGTEHHVHCELHRVV